jgi:hypothetical protein
MRVAPWVIVAPCLVLGACSAIRQLPDGSYRVQCQDHVDECREQAKDYCLDRGGVEEVSSREKDKLYGVEGHEQGVLVSEVVFYCGDDAPRRPIPLPPRPTTADTVDGGGPGVDPSLIAPEAMASEPAAAPPSTKRVCIPGTTQRCVGVGACVGGQICSPDGLAWGPCDCGPPTAVSAAAAAPSAAAAAPSAAAAAPSAAAAAPSAAAPSAAPSGVGASRTPTRR